MTDRAPERMVSLGAARRQQGVELLHRLVGQGKLDLAEFDSAFDQLTAAHTEADLLALIESLPAPFRMTPPERRLTDPLILNAYTQNIRLRGHWQVAADTTIKTGTGNITVDLTGAEFDARVVHLTVKVVTGNATVLVPRGMAVQLVGKTASATMDLDPPLPGYPVVLLTAGAVTGRVRVRHPRERRLRWWRRRQAGTR